MKTTIAHQYLFAALFVTFSVLSLTPMLARADQQSQPQTMALNLAGEATAIGNGLAGTTTLKLTASTYTNSNQWLIIQNVTGNLRIGSMDFQIIGGQGSVNEFGDMALFGDTNMGKSQLTLHGSMKGSSVMFESPQSQLASTSYLTLSGTIAPTTGQTANATTNSANTGGNTTSSVTSSVNETQGNSTFTSSTAMLQNTTTPAANMTSTLNANVTVEATNTTENFVTTSSSVIDNGTLSYSNGAGQHNVTIHVVQGEGEICLSSRDQMPVCTTSSQTVSVNNGELVNFEATADNGFIWDHYDGLGAGQGQDFNAVITQDNTTGVYFKPMVSGNANVTAAAFNLTANNITTTSTSVNSTVTPLTGTPVPSNITVTVTQYVNQTISVTQTVANVTISHTVTSTVANTTITQANVTMTVNATTTATGP